MMPKKWRVPPETGGSSEEDNHLEEVEIRVTKPFKDSLPFRQVRNRIPSIPYFPPAFGK